MTLHAGRDARFPAYPFAQYINKDDPSSYDDGYEVSLMKLKLPSDDAVFSLTIWAVRIAM
jgi:hypothetical protein